ncbi:hypothetical protein [Lentzea sp. NPDC060358]|uniref:hypothetical protein n=1 Tax=Lentzea sp. NPDC060358 TaxID=3347103 RepID=UPI003647BC9D
MDLPTHPPSRLLVHPGCADCADAVAWLLSVDRAYQRMGSRTAFGLSWMLDHFRWGPSRWPAAWCELAGAETADCGVFADLCATVLETRGVGCERLQIVESAAPAQTRLWREQWEAAGAVAGWILSEDWVYHESLLIDTPTGLCHFDPSEMCEIGTERRVLWVRQAGGEWGSWQSWDSRSDNALDASPGNDAGDGEERLVDIVAAFQADA